MAAALVTAPFVGREIEMAGLRASLDVAGAGRGRLVLITGEPVSDQAIEMARRLNDEEALLVALHGRHWATFAPDQGDVRLANAKEMLRVATNRGDDEMAFMARHALLHCCLELYDIDGMDAELMAMTDLAGRIRQPFYL